MHKHSRVMKSLDHGIMSISTDTHTAVKPKLHHRVAAMGRSTMTSKQLADLLAG